MEFSFKLIIPMGINGIDIENNKVDVEVIFSESEKERYVATFITLKYIKKIFENNFFTGEYKNGLYFPCPNTIIVKKLTESVIGEIVEDLLKEKGFKNIFSKIK